MTAKQPLHPDRFIEAIAEALGGANHTLHDTYGMPVVIVRVEAAPRQPTSVIYMQTTHGQPVQNWSCRIASPLILNGDALICAAMTSYHVAVEHDQITDVFDGTLEVEALDERGFEDDHFDDDLIEADDSDLPLAQRRTVGSA